MEKSPQAFRTISEVSSIVQVPAHVLRFWEGKFTQVRPIKRGGGRRYYRPEDVQLLIAIKELLYTEGLTIRGVQKMLREQGVKTLSHRFSPDSVAMDDFGGRADEAAREDDETDDLWNDVPAEGLATEEEDTRMSEPAMKHTVEPAGDPARAAKMRSVLTRLEALRARMVAHPAPDLGE